ncbi:MAG: M23 family metallopeptidase [Candidatus Nanogingivalis sp.]
MDEKDFSNLSDENRENLNRNGQNWNSAKSIRGEDGYNPNSLADLENSGTSGEKAQEDKILQKESSPWENNVQKGGSHNSRTLAQNNGSTKSRIKGKFPKAAKYISILTAGGSIAGIGLYSSFIVGLAPMHITEMITEKLNSAASILETRSPIMLSNKLKKNAGIQCSRIKAACKFSSVSDSQIEKLKKNGFNVETEVDSTTGKTRIKNISIEIDGEVVKVDETNLRKTLLTNSKFRSSTKKAYSGKFASFLDSVAAKFQSKFGLSKVSPNNEGKTEAELNEEMTTKANKTGGDVDLKTEEKQAEEDGDSEETKKSKAAYNENVDKNKNFIDNIKSKATGLSDTLDIKTKANNIKNILDGTGIIQLPCTLYSVGNMINIGVKTIRAVTLAQFTLDFLSFSNKLMSGHATPEEFSMIGAKIMGTATFLKATNTSSSQESTSRLEDAFSYFASTASANKVRSFTESQGWRALAYNDKLGGLDDSAYKYTVGTVGAMFEFFTKIRTAINNATGNQARTICKVMNSNAMNWVEAGVGILSGAAIGALANLLLDQVVGAVIGKALEGLPNMLAGKIVTEGTQGEDYGNAIVSGAGSLMSKNTVSGGGSTLTKSEAVAFYQQNEIRIAENGAYERSIRSPFDATTRHTFLGSIVSSTLPYSQSLASISGFIPSVFSIFSKSFSSILPGASAADAANFEANMNICQDEDIKSLNIATDPFCNPYTGISTSTLTKETEEVVEYLANSGEINTDTEDPMAAIKSGSKFESYVKNCVNRENPIGVGEDSNDMGLECSSVNNPNVAYYAAYLTDVRIQDGMDKGVMPGGEGSDSSTSLAGNAKNKDCKAGDLCWPIQSDNPESTITSPFGFYTGTTTPHHGIDFGVGGVTFGTPVYAIADGEVVGVGNQSAWGGAAWGYGPNILNGGGIGSCSGLGGGGGEQVVNLKHSINGKDVYSFYMHMQKNSDLKVGQRISAGTQVGEVGSYGCSTGAHLHLEVKEGSINSPSVDPRKYL